MANQTLTGLLHVLFSLRAEGCPRLALALLQEEIEQTGRRGAVAFATDDKTDLEAEFQKLNAPLISLSWRRRGFIKLGVRARQVLSEIRPRGVICYTVGLHVPIAMAAWSLDIPIVVHLGNAPPASDKIAQLKIRCQMLAGRPFVMRYAACSEYVRQESIRVYGLPNDLVVTVPNGIRLHDFTRFNSKKNYHPERKPLTVGMVGSFEMHKDQETLLKAIQLLTLKSVDVRLRLVGDGANAAYLREKAERLGISKLVEWVGKTTDVSRELAQLDVFAYSVRQEEGLGIALVEALAAGLPVVASDVGACREVLDGGRYGRLVPPQNASEWAAALAAPLPTTVSSIKSLSRYDIRETARAYDALLTEA